MLKHIQPIPCNFLGDIFYVDWGDCLAPIKTEAVSTKGPREVIRESPDEDPHFFVFVTDGCNLSCHYCFEGREGGFSSSISQPQYSIEELVVFLRSLNRRRISIWFFGGEPLLNKSWIQQCVERLNMEDFEMSWNITTNLVCLTREFADFSKKHDIRYTVNLNATWLEESGRKYQMLVMKNIKLLTSLGVNVMGMSVWSPKSPFSIQKLMEDYSDCGMKYFACNLAWGFFFSKEDLRTLKAELEHFCRFYLESILKHDSRFLWIQPFSQYIRTLVLGTPLNATFCEAGKSLGAIALDGSIYPCQSLTSFEPLRCGSIQSKEWSRPFLGLDDSSIPRCSSCALVHCCKARCLANNMMSNGSVLNPNQTRCDAEEIIFSCSAFIVKELMEHPIEYRTIKKVFGIESGLPNVSH